MTAGGVNWTMDDLFDRYYREYDAWYEKNWYAYLSELEAVKTFVPPGKRGLEIGVGSGRFAGPLGIAVGVDPSVRMVEMARERGVDARTGCGEALPFEDSTFDYAALIFTLCFVKDPEKVINESIRVLSPGGNVVVGIVDKKSFLGKACLEKESVFYAHARFFDTEEVTRMLTAAGLSDFSYRQSVFDYPDRLATVEEPREGFGDGGFVVINAVK